MSNNNDNQAESELQERIDLKTGLYSMALAAKFKSIPVSGSELQQKFGHLSSFSITELKRAFSELGIHANNVKVNAKSIQKMNLPAILEVNGEYILLKEIDGEVATIFEYGEQETKSYELDSLLNACGGQIVLIW